MPKESHTHWGVDHFSVVVDTLYTWRVTDNTVTPAVDVCFEYGEKRFASGVSWETVKTKALANQPAVVSETVSAQIVCPAAP